MVIAALFATAVMVSTVVIPVHTSVSAIAKAVPDVPINNSSVPSSPASDPSTLALLSNKSAVNK